MQLSGRLQRRTKDICSLIAIVIHGRIVYRSCRCSNTGTADIHLRPVPISRWSNDLKKASRHEKK
jgi:hypothetical protein